MPSVLVELGYVSNKEDLKQLTSDDWRERTADADRPGGRHVLHDRGWPASPAELEGECGRKPQFEHKTARLSRTNSTGAGVACPAESCRDRTLPADCRELSGDVRIAAGAGRRRGDCGMRLLLRFFGFLFAAGTILFLVGVGGRRPVCSGISRKDLPDYSQLQDYEPPVMTRVHAVRRLAARRICARAAALYADPGGAEAGDQRLPRRRGQEFLRARRPRLLRHRARRRCCSCRTTAAAAARRAPRPSPSRSPRTSC